MTSTPQDLTNQIIGFLPWTTQALVSKDIYNTIKAKLHAGKIILRAMRAHKIRIQTIIEYELPCSIDLIRANYILYYPHDLRYEFIQYAVSIFPVDNHADQIDYPQKFFKLMIKGLSESQLAIIGW